MLQIVKFGSFSNIGRIQFVFFNCKTGYINPSNIKTMEKHPLAALMMVLADVASTWQPSHQRN